MTITKIKVFCCLTGEVFFTVLIQLSHTNEIVLQNITFSKNKPQQSWSLFLLSRPNICYVKVFVSSVVTQTLFR